jgi:hypothetical protein
MPYLDTPCYVCGSTDRVSNHHIKYPTEKTYPLCVKCHFAVGLFAEQHLNNLWNNEFCTREHFINRFHMTPEECQTIREKYPFLVQRNEKPTLKVRRKAWIYHMYIVYGGLSVD